jgi:hypothetical protein
MGERKGDKDAKGIKRRNERTGGNNIIGRKF